MKPNKRIKAALALAIALLYATRVESTFVSRPIGGLAFVPQKPKVSRSEQKSKTTVAKERNVFTPPQKPQRGISNWAEIERCRQEWDLSPEQTIRLHQLCETLADMKHPKNNPHEVVRFLQESKGKSLAEVEHMFRAMIAWREEHHIDGMLDDYHPPSLVRYFPGGVL